MSTSGVGFDKFNLNLFGNIQFFGNCSMRAIRSSYNDIFRDTPNNLSASEQWNKDYSDAQFCRMRMLAEEWMLEDGWTLPEDWLIYIGEELTQHFLEYFDKYCHEARFPPKDPLEATELALDAEQKASDAKLRAAWLLCCVVDSVLEALPSFWKGSEGSHRAQVPANIRGK